jgi:hypothetical protein
MLTSNSLARLRASAPDRPIYRGFPARLGLEQMSKTGTRILATGPFRAHPLARDPACMAEDPEIIGGPTPIQAPSAGFTYRWKVQDGRAEKHVYVQIADPLRPEAFEEPLRSSIESKGESVLRKLLERGNVPIRIKITSAGITEVGVDRRSRPCLM